VQFFQKLDVDIVSCIPKNVPLTKVLLAQANIRNMSSRYFPMDIDDSYPNDWWLSGSLFG